MVRDRRLGQGSILLFLLINGVFIETHLSVTTVKELVKMSGIERSASQL
jgi:hypothetical protein